MTFQLGGKDLALSSGSAASCSYCRASVSRCRRSAALHPPVSVAVARSPRTRRWDQIVSEAFLSLNGRAHRPIEGAGAIWL